jgi:hypothetical protein
MPRSFSSLSQAEDEMAERTYLGIHWHFDKTAGTIRPTHRRLHFRSRILPVKSE